MRGGRKRGGHAETLVEGKECVVRAEDAGEVWKR